MEVARIPFFNFGILQEKNSCHYARQPAMPVVNGCVSPLQRHSSRGGASEIWDDYIQV